MYPIEPKEGFEPPTNCLQDSRSDQTELHRLNEVAAEALHEPLRTFSALRRRHLRTPDRIRTCDPTVKSGLLYQLSYEGISLSRFSLASLLRMVRARFASARDASLRAAHGLHQQPVTPHLPPPCSLYGLATGLSLSIFSLDGPRLRVLARFTPSFLARRVMRLLSELGLAPICAAISTKDLPCLAILLNASICSRHLMCLGFSMPRCLKVPSAVSRWKHGSQVGPCAKRPLRTWQMTHVPSCLVTCPWQESNLQPPASETGAHPLSFKGAVSQGIRLPDADATQVD